MKNRFFVLLDCIGLFIICFLHTKDTCTKVGMCVYVGWRVFRLRLNRDHRRVRVKHCVPLGIAAYSHRSFVVESLRGGACLVIAMAMQLPPIVPSFESV